MQSEAHILQYGQKGYDDSQKMTRHIPHLGPPIWTFRKTELQKTQRNASNSKSVVNGKFWHPFFCLDANHQNQKTFLF